MKLVFFLLPTASLCCVTRDPFTVVFSNVNAPTKRVFKQTMRDIERFSDDVLRFQENATHPCLFVTMSGTLASHTFGVVSMSDDFVFMQINKWKFDRSTDIQKKMILFHEFGHVLGFPHSNNTKDIMFAHMNRHQRIDSFVQLVRRKFKKKKTTTYKALKPFERVVNATIVPTSFGECLVNSKLPSNSVVFSASNELNDRVLKLIDVAHAFLESITPLRFVMTDDRSRSCIHYSTDDVDSFVFPPTFKPTLPLDVQFMVYVFRHFSNASQSVVFRPSLKLLPNEPRQRVVFDRDVINPIVYYFFVFFTHVLGFVPSNNNIFLDPTNAYHGFAPVINNCLADFTLLVQAVRMYIVNSEFDLQETII